MRALFCDEIRSVWILACPSTSLPVGRFHHLKELSMQVHRWSIPQSPPYWTRAFGIDVP
jgi:hypothetical protein